MSSESLPSKAGDWAIQNRGKLLFCLRMTAAALLSHLLGEALGLAQAYWAVLSAIIVMQGSVGGSLTAGINRLVGTIGGAVWGTLVALLLPHGNATQMAVALTVSVAPLALATAFRPAYRVAPITAIIVLMAASLQQANPVSSALSRVIEISLGSAVAIAVAVFFVPARAHRLLGMAGASATATMAELISVLAAAFEGKNDAHAIGALHKKLRIGLAQAETRAQEASVERANRLSDGPDPEPLVRTLRRLRHDLAMLTRIVGAPFGEGIKLEVGGGVVGLLQVLETWFKGTAKALSTAAPPPSLEPVENAISVCKALLSDASHKEEHANEQRLQVLSFLFDQMLQNLRDLFDRAAELAATRPGQIDT